MKKHLMMFLVVTIVLGLSIGYSAYNQELMISGDAYVRVLEDIRITNISLVESNGSSETYNSKYSKNTTSMFASFNGNSSITYAVTITNSSSDDYVLDDLIISNLPDEVHYEVSDTLVGDIIKGNSEVTLQITFISTSNENVNLLANYDFKKLEQIEFDYDYTGEIITFIAPANGIYKLECWGAQGGDVPDTYSSDHIGGYGGYSVGAVSLNKGDELYVVIGGTGEDSFTSSAGYRAKGGYNGGGYSYVQASRGTLFAAGGGGATHIATSTGLLRELENSKDDVLIVAGGGAGAYGYGTTTWWNGNSGGDIKADIVFTKYMLVHKIQDLLLVKLEIQPMNMRQIIIVLEVEVVIMVAIIHMVKEELEVALDI